MNQSNAEERAKLITGLRDLADFLEARNEVPAPRWADLYVFPSGLTDEERKREIDTIAALIGSPVANQTASYRTYTTTRSFGPVQYHAAAITSDSPRAPRTPISGEEA